MKITWLGQAGLLFQWDDVTLMIDPYLSDSVGKINPQRRRKALVPNQYLHIAPTVIICTHNHLDHHDPETLINLLDTDRKIEVLGPKSCFDRLRSFGRNHNYILFNRHTQWTTNSIRLTAVKAEHSDPFAIGVVIDDGYKKYYITGDTLYNDEIFPDIPPDIDIVFLPVNGTGNNMNFSDAARFAKKIKARIAVPVHYGLFDDINPLLFGCENKMILTMFEKKEL